MIKEPEEDDGYVLVVAIFTLFILTLIGMAVANITETELWIAGNQKRHKIAFYAAESGIEAARAALNDLKVADSGNWDNLLAGSRLAGQGANVTSLNGVIDAAGGRNVGPASFSLAVRDNNDLDGNNLVDTDNVLFVTSTGTYGTAEAQVEARVLYTGDGDEYAQEHYDAKSTAKAAREDGAVAQIRRW